MPRLSARRGAAPVPTSPVELYNMIASKLMEKFLWIPVSHDFILGGHKKHAETSHQYHLWMIEMLNDVFSKNLQQSLALYNDAKEMLDDRYFANKVRFYLSQGDEAIMFPAFSYKEKLQMLGGHNYLNYNFVTQNPPYDVRYVYIEAFWNSFRDKVLLLQIMFEHLGKPKISSRWKLLSNKIIAGHELIRRFHSVTLSRINFLRLLAFYNSKSVDDIMSTITKEDKSAIEADKNTVQQFFKAQGLETNHLLHLAASLQFQYLKHFYVTLNTKVFNFNDIADDLAFTQYPAFKTFLQKLIKTHELTIKEPVRNDDAFAMIPHINELYEEWLKTKGQDRDVIDKALSNNKTFPEFFRKVLKEFAPQAKVPILLTPQFTEFIMQ